jgi:hypothetical protein
VVSEPDPYGGILGFLDRSRYFFLPSSSSSVLTREWTPFQTHYFSENLVAPVIEPGPLDLQPGTLTTRSQERSTFFYITYEYINSVCMSQDTQYISVL